MLRSGGTIFLGRIAMLRKALFGLSPSANLAGVDEENHTE